MVSMLRVRSSRFQGIRSGRTPSSPDRRGDIALSFAIHHGYLNWILLPSVSTPHRHFWNKPLLLYIYGTPISDHQLLRPGLGAGAGASSAVHDPAYISDSSCPTRRLPKLLRRSSISLLIIPSGRTGSCPTVNAPWAPEIDDSLDRSC